MQSNATSTGVRPVFLWIVTDTCLYLRWTHTAVPQVACMFKKVLQDIGYSHINISIYGISKLNYSTVQHNSPILVSITILMMRHFTGLCKSVHPWGRVPEIQSIKGTVLSCGGQPCVLLRVVCSSLSERLNLLLHIAILAALQHTQTQILLFIWQKLK